MSRERVGLERLRNARGQTIEALAHIGRFDGQKDFHLAGNAQHGRRSRMSRTFEA